MICAQILILFLSPLKTILNFINDRMALNILRDHGSGFYKSERGTLKLNPKNKELQAQQNPDVLAELHTLD